VTRMTRDVWIFRGPCGYSVRDWYEQVVGDVYECIARDSYEYVVRESYIQWLTH